MAPSHASASVRVSAKRWQGYVQAGLLSREIPEVRGADVVGTGGRQHRRLRYCELPAGPARSKNPSMHGNSMRENREIPCLSVWLITGRAVQGRPRS